jgi:hypothetical protein
LSRFRFAGKGDRPLLDFQQGVRMAAGKETLASPPAIECNLFWKPAWSMPPPD